MVSRGEHGHDEEDIRRIVPHTWHALLGRFGRLRDIQRVAIPEIARGRSVLVTAPTASGKTEALVAPIGERILAARARACASPPALRAVIVTPTRALANDLHKRLQTPLGEAALGVAIKTGDSPSFDLESPPDILITTPESLDSLEARHPAALRSVVAVILDEVQLLRGTARGDQLRCLLTRLDRIAYAPPQRCAATATVVDPETLSREFLGPDALCLKAAGATGAQRAIDAHLAPAAILSQAAAAVARLFNEEPGRKLLVFANTRGEVESLAALLGSLPALASRVYAHHGSLARGERLRVERQFKGGTTGVCVATMTLELGIDIGDVDRVVLLSPPPDVASLLQRVGRSNRREAVTKVLGLYAGELERRRFEHLLDCAARGRLFDDPVSFRPTVIAQQSLSMLMQNASGWVSPEVVHGRLPEDAARLWSRSDCRAILDALAEGGYLRAVSRDRFVADAESTHLFERGRIHSMIEDVRETEVVDALTGQSVGRVRFGKADEELVRAGGGVSLALGGRKRAVTHVRENKLYVRTADGSEEARFIAREAPRYSAGLAADLAAFLGMRRGTMSIEQLKDGSWRLAHFLGSVWGQMLGWLLTAAGHKARDAGPFFVRLDQPLPAGRLEIGNEESATHLVDRLVTAEQRSLARRLGAGPFRDVVPRSIMDRWVRESVDTDGFVRRALEARVVDERLLCGERDGEHRS
ncbi:MAG: DEAD/DEAH box helicase [Acidobacteria bacterium]|nr:DEAD/DEAH box helicase [Acidobacteriota bacterium]